MRYAAAAIAILIASSAKAAPVTCTFSDEEQTMLTTILDIVSGAENRPRGGMANARLANYLSLKFSGLLAPEINCKPVPPPEKPKDEPAK